MNFIFSFRRMCTLLRHLCNMSMWYNMCIFFMWPMYFTLYLHVLLYTVNTLFFSCPISVVFHFIRGLLTDADVQMSFWITLYCWISYTFFFFNPVWLWDLCIYVCVFVYVYMLCAYVMKFQSMCSNFNSWIPFSFMQYTEKCFRYIVLFIGVCISGL